MIPIPRHREIGEGLTEQIYRECQPKLGKGLVEAMSHFTVHVTRDGRFWLISSPSTSTPRMSRAAHLARAAKLREESRRAQPAAAAELREAARELRNAGMPLRDIGQLLDVSYQRAHQLVNS